jgi:hypothetical protein
VVDTFFPEVHGIFSKTEHILRHKASFNKYKKIEITSCILSDHNETKLGVSSETIETIHRD